MFMVGENLNTCHEVSQRAVGELNTFRTCPAVAMRDETCPLGVGKD